MQAISHYITGLREENVSESLGKLDLTSDDCTKFNLHTDNVGLIKYMKDSAIKFFKVY